MKVALLALCTASSGVFSAELNVYSARKEALIKPALDKFAAKTGIQVNLVTGKDDALISRMASEGQFSPADVLLTADAGRLVRAKSQGLTQAYQSKIVENNVPAHLRDQDSHWLALTMRARPIMYAPDRVKPTELDNIEGLADAKWKGRVCIRSSGNIYNQSLVAAMLAQQGEAQTLSWMQGLVKNFARPPKGGDRDQIKAVAAGQCDLAVANTYYLGGMYAGDQASQAAASKVKVFWPNQNNRGAHVNISGIAIAKHAKNIEAAKQLIAFMLSADTQAWYASINHEYPVVEGVAWSDVLSSFGQFKAESVALGKVGELNAEALKLMDKAGWK